MTPRNPAAGTPRKLSAGAVVFRRTDRGPRLHDNNGEFSEFTLWGPTCDSYDVLPQVFTLPADIDEDDWIEFGLMGAYTQASLTPFNGFDRRDQFWVEEVYTGKDMAPE